MGVYFSSNSEERKQEEEAKRIEAVSVKQRVKSSEYSENKLELLTQFSKSLDNGDYQSTLHSIEYYYPHLNNNLKNELTPLYVKALLGVVKQIPANKFDENLSVYEKLITLKPNDQTIQKKYEHYKKASKTLKDVKGRLSSYDGSYEPLVRYVKENMKNPSSFEHIETRYSVQPQKIYVTMKYRGTNGFGAIVIESSKVEIELNGHSTVIN